MPKINFCRILMLISFVHSAHRTDFFTLSAVDTAALIDHNRTFQQIDTFLRTDTVALSADNAVRPDKIIKLL